MKVQPPLLEIGLLERLCRTVEHLGFSYDADSHCWTCVVKLGGHDVEGSGADMLEAIFYAMLALIETMHHHEGEGS